MSQMISGLEALYSRNILYRDLKLDNILFCFTSEVDKNNLNMLRATAKITDFGFAIILNRAQPLAHTLIGNPTYMERTLLNNMEQRKKNPFIGTNMQDVFNKVKIGTYPLPNNLS